MYGLGYDCMKTKCKNCERQRECDMWDRLTYRPFENIVKEFKYDIKNSQLCVVTEKEKKAT